ncbi:phytanoyl-CoA dioxygenase family protein [Cohnella hashimotonis]|uniref:Phytanoyl-CoA dioxygenase family protein n=1 Tax=Cohnella hashimotonis TaxID=2826895 RepID=A0ABT6TN44_9BACL|nr:phytanoyl-CoA dioxygenase family protein [Cohnella hashimotonis]MDI4648170.1 phytanoyl-CoA dioxygenase family protein [Cohnella hashimotonis]
MTTLATHFAKELEQLHKDGYVLFKGVLDRGQAAALKEGIRQAFEGKDDNVMMQGPMFERGEIFEALVDHPVISTFIEKVLGPDCQLSSMNGMRTTRNNGVSKWHVDEALFFPLPEGAEIDASIPMPVFLMNALYYLDDVTEDQGPTQVVPGSHRAGRAIRHAEEIGEYKGQGAISILAEAGDCLVFNSQIWHRGARNQSDDPRYVQQVIYRKKFIVPHMTYDINGVYRVPEEIAQRSNPRRRRLMGYSEQVF